MNDDAADAGAQRHEQAPEQTRGDDPTVTALETVANTSDDGARERFSEESVRLPGTTGLSKNQLKKLRRFEKMQATKKERRKVERERRKERQKAAKARGEALAPDRKHLRSVRMADSPCRMTVAIDCSFDKLMTDKDISKLVKQIQHCYAINRRAPHPCQYFVTSVGGRMLQRLKMLDGYNSWDVNFRETSYLEEFEKQRVVYLSSESENVMDTVSDDTVYIIGGLVDHNSQKGLCHRLAVENGIGHARLPLDKYVSMKTRRVLTIDHVFEILCQYYVTHDWEKSFSAVLPKRKEAIPLGQAGGDGGCADDGDGSYADDGDGGCTDDGNGGCAPSAADNSASGDRNSSSSDDDGDDQSQLETPPSPSLPQPPSLGCAANEAAAP